MSAIIGRYVRDGDMQFGSELCLDCADAFKRLSSSKGRRDVTVLWISNIHTCTMQGADKCWTLKALRQPDALNLPRNRRTAEDDPVVADQTLRPSR